MSLIRVLSLVVIAVTMGISVKTYLANDDQLVASYKICRAGIPGQTTSRACSEVLAQQILPDVVRSAMLRSRALSYLAENDPDQALADVNEAIRLTPDSDRGYWIRSQIHLERDDLERAKSDYVQANSVSSDGIAYTAWWVSQMKKLGQHEQALTACQQLSLLDPTNTFGQSCRVKSLLRLNRTDEAVELLMELTEIGSDRNKAGAYFFLGRIYLHLNYGKDETLSVFQKLQELVDDKRVAELFLAATYLKFGDREKGEELIDDLARYMMQDMLVHPVGPWKTVKTLLARVAFRDALPHHFKGIAYAVIREYDLARREFDTFVAQGDPNARLLLINLMMEKGFVPSEDAATHDPRQFERALEQYMTHYGRKFSFDNLLN